MIILASISAIGHFKPLFIGIRPQKSISVGPYYLLLVFDTNLCHYIPV